MKEAWNTAQAGLSSTSRLLSRGVVPLLALALVAIALAPFVWELRNVFDSHYCWHGSFHCDSGLVALRKIWRQDEFVGPFERTVQLAIAATILTLLCAVPAAYALTRFRFKGAEVFFVGALLTLFAPALMLMLPLWVTFMKINDSTGISLMTGPGITLVYTGLSLPVAIFILRGVMASIPRELEDAALVDGASHMSALVRVVLPSAAPGLLAVTLWIFLLVWSDPVFSNLLLDISTPTVPAAVSGYYARNYSSVIAVVGSLPMLVVFLVGQRYFLRAFSAWIAEG
jgi:multiple sugar transport system permease protein